MLAWRLPVLAALLLSACAEDTLNTIPSKPVVEEPEAPVAIAKLHSDINPDLIRPLDTIKLDGRDSFDPADRAIVTYKWTVLEAPEGVNEDDFGLQNSAQSEMFLPLAGRYTLLLTVTNDLDVESINTPDARVTFEAVPSDDFLVELTWDDTTNDQDLHLVNLGISPELCGETDCYYGNMTPRWYTSSAAGEGANPALDIDDMDGMGPENINIDAPRASSYRIYVHYFDDYGEPTTNTVKIWVDGEVVETYSRTIYPGEVWAVAEIDWNAAGVANISTFPSDGGGTGAVEYLTGGCWFDPYYFPE